MSSRVLLRAVAPLWVVSLSLLTCPAPLLGQDAIPVDRLVRQLGSDSFAEREAASEALERLGAGALAPLRQARAANHDAEARRRAARLIDVIEESLYREVSCFRGHRRSVCGVAFSPDGRRAVSGSDDGTARLWDVETGKELARLSGTGPHVLSVNISADGRRGLVGGEDGPARLWDLTTGQELLRSGFGGGRGMVFLPDGRRALSVGKDGTVCLWDTRTGLDERSFDVGEGVGVAALSPDGHRVLWGAAAVGREDKQSAAPLPGRGRAGVVRDVFAGRAPGARRGVGRDRAAVGLTAMTQRCRATFPPWERPGVVWKGCCCSGQFPSGLPSALASIPLAFAVGRMADHDFGRMDAGGRGMTVRGAVWPWRRGLLDGAPDDAGLLLGCHALRPCRLPTLTRPRPLALWGVDGRPLVRLESVPGAVRRDVDAARGNGTVGSARAS
jgi:hypothetical protein